MACQHQEEKLVQVSHTIGSTVLSVFLACLCAISGPVSTVQGRKQEAKSLQIIEVGDLTLPLLKEARVPIHPLLGEHMPGLENLVFRVAPEDGEDDHGMGIPDNDDEEVEQILESDVLVELIRSRVSPSSWEEDGVRLELRGSRLFVVHTKAVRDKVQELLACLRAVLTEPLRLEVAIYLESGNDETSKGLEALQWNAARKRLNALREAGGPSLLHTTRATIRPGKRFYLGTQQEGRVQVGFDGEVAKGAKMIQPKNKGLRLGTGLGIEVFQVPGEPGMALFGSLEHRRLDQDVEIEAVGTPEIKGFERAVIRESVTAFSVLLPRKGAFVYAPGGAQEPRLRLLLTFHRGQETQPGPVDVLPHGFLTRRIHVDHVSRNVEHDTGEDLGTVVLDRDEIQVMLQSGIPPDLVDSEAFGLDSNAHAVIIAAPVKARQAIRKNMEGLTGDRARNFLATISWDKRLQGSKDEWQHHGMPLTVPVLAGKCAAMLQGRSTSYLRGYEVEIADEVGIQIPQLAAVFSGLQSQLVFLPMQGQILAHVECSATSVLQVVERKPFATGMGKTERPRQEGLFVKRRMALQPGVRRLLGSGPTLIDSEGQKWDTRLHLQVRELRAGFWGEK